MGDKACCRCHKQSNRSRFNPHRESGIRLTRLRACDTSYRSARLFQLLQLSVLLSNPSVQVPPLDICKFGPKQSAIPLNVSPMVPHLGRIEVSYPPSLDVPQSSC
jgi:hypothetical protein